MSFDRAQHKSDTFRYGDKNEAHELGLWQAFEYFQVRGLHPVVPFPTQFSQTFLAWNTNKGLTFEQWELDMAVFGPSCGLEGEDPLYIVEIDGEKHTKRAAMINDGIVSEWVKFRYPNTKFVRLWKYDCNDPKYMKKMIGI